ncbi:MAG: hypothetical protein M3552_05200 [Planctomycetota bacterium]|nr:hypothetical protein [Planctomycetaceae bacterium]MDQ3330036.1 hypothetical protein [Planctomycetota bacterium]
MPDDPFAVDSAAASGAIALSPKRTPQRPNKVVCPMCDTVGLAPDSASGKDVRCANRKCLVPVFTAPDFAAPQAVEPEPQPSSLGPTLLTFGAVLLILIAGASVWWFVLRKPDVPGSAAPIVDTPSQPAVPETPSVGGETPAVAQPNAPAPPTPAESLAAVLGRWPNIAEDITQPAQQPLRRRYAAESYGIAGRPDLARAQLEKLASLRSADPFYQIAPLTELAWHELATGDERAAKATFEKSAALTNQIPRQGFDPARNVMVWSATAARLGDADAAHRLVRASRDDDQDGDQLLALLAAASLFHQHDLNQEYPLRPIVPWSQPKSAATTFSLLGRGARDHAREWAATTADSTSRAENLATWAEAQSLETTGGPTARAAAIGEAISSVNPVEKTYVAARAAVRAGSGEEKQVAEALFGIASEAAGQLQAPAPGSAADLAEFSRYELPDQASVRLAAVGLGETAHAAALLGKDDDAQKFLTQALDHLKAAVPPGSTVAERSQEFKSLGIAGVRNRLKSELGLSDDQAETAANAYRRKIDSAASAAAARTDLQAELLARAVAWKLGSFALAEAKRRTEAADGGVSETLLSGSAGGRLIGAFEKSGDRLSADAVRATGATNRDVPLVPAMELTLEPLLKDGKAAEAARELFASRWSGISASEKIGIAIRAACRLSEETSATTAFEFATSVPDGNARLEVLRYLSACAAQAGQAAEIEKLSRNARLSSTEQAAVLRGLTEGLVDADATVETGAKTASAVQP